MFEEVFDRTYIAVYIPIDHIFIIFVFKLFYNLPEKRFNFSGSLFCVLTKKIRPPSSLYDGLYDVGFLWI